MTITIARACAAAALVLSLGAAGCSAPDVDLAKVVKVGDITTGWFDVGIVDGQNKLVPTAIVHRHQHGHRDAERPPGLHRVPVHRRDRGTRDRRLVMLRGAEALGPSATSKPITVRANWGFSGLQPRAQMLMHSQFKDARAEIFVKFGAKPFVKIGEAQIARQLLTK
ncbi:MAG: hypothetical protein MZV64_13595 [Ignavibacteriales bacterium]|nr:hypothetical protein [Ignavibacteriales bacterium]